MSATINYPDTDVKFHDSPKIILDKILQSIVTGGGGGGGSGVTGVYSGSGPPGALVPAGTAAVYFDEDTGDEWHFYDGVWH